VAAIRILNPSLVQGRIGDHYRLGWKHEDEISQDFIAAPGPAPSRVEPPAPKSAPGMDVLNQGLEP
jgi:ferredoxin-type protein NapG